MKKQTAFPFVIMAVASALANISSTQAGSLKKAELTQIINEVGVIQPGQGERRAAVNDVIEGKLGVRTGQKSRAELVFEDETLTRLGANTIFNFEDGSRNMDLNQGTILLQVPKNAGGATIRTAAVTAAVTGTTILFEHTPASVVPEALKKSEDRRQRRPHGYIKALVLEGYLKVWLKGKIGESILIGPGQMLIMADDATSIPELVDFDVATVMKTSKLLDQTLWVGRKRQFQVELIGQEIDEQRKKKDLGELIETNLFINGRGTTIVIGDGAEQPHIKDSLPLVQPPIPEKTPQPDPDPRGPSVTPIPPENDLKNFAFIGSTDIFDSDGIANFDPSLPGNVQRVNALIDASGGTNVFPTSGNQFGVLSTGGTAPNGNPYTATLGTTTLGSMPASNARSFVELDYRFLTNEIGSGTGNNDTVEFAITNDSGMSLSYKIDRNLLQADGQSLTPLARANVGGFLAGTDWLTLKLEITPFVSAGNSAFTIAIYDFDSNDGDSALAIDRYQVTNEFLVAPNSDLIGDYSINFLNGVTLGEDPGEYRAPGLRGREGFEVEGPGSNGGSFSARTTSGDLIVNGQILADTGPNRVGTGNVIYGGEGGKVNLVSSLSSVKVNSRIQVSSDDAASRRISASGGEISVSSFRTGGTGVEISNTGELLSLLNAASPGPGGKIFISTSDSNVLVNGGKIIATRGEVDMRTLGADRQITLNNAQIRGDIVKIGALGNNGQVFINGGQISADTTLKLYAGGNNGSVVFTANTQLSGASAKYISANTVTVQNGVNVQVNGPPVDVYTNNPNYTGSGGNNSTKGTFSGTGAKTFSATDSSAPPPFD